MTKEKPSAVKKLMKPQKGVLHLVVEREEEEDKDMAYLTSAPPPPSGESWLRAGILLGGKRRPFWSGYVNQCNEHGVARRSGGMTLQKFF